jgi:hypothetical protein
MTTPDFEALARRLVAECDGGSECTCANDYSLRGKRDPQCRWHQFGENAFAAVATALRRVHEEGHMQGMIDALTAEALKQGPRGGEAE